VRHTEGTDYTLRMLYWECRTRVSYARQIGTSALFPTRAPGEHSGYTPPTYRDRKTAPDEVIS